MEKIEFIIPKNEGIYIDNKNINETFENNNANVIHKPKIESTYNYTPISPNVYRFNTPDINIVDDINLNYTRACELKKTNIHSAINLFKKCTELFLNNTPNIIKYEIYINLSLSLSNINGKGEEIEKYYKKAIDIFSDRAEPYYYWALHCNKYKQFEKSYNLLNTALSFKYEDCVIKYPGAQRSAYDKYLYDELAVSCYWLKQYDSAKCYLETIIDDPDFSSSRERLLKNLEFTHKGLENMI